MTPLRLVVFDCDGTLVDSQHTIVRAMEKAFSSLDLEAPPSAEIRHIVGLSLGDAIKRLTGAHHETRAGEIIEAYKTAYFEMRSRGEAEEDLYPAVRETLEILESHDVLLGIATGKSLRGLKATLGRHGLLGKFATLQTACRNPGKPNPAMLHEALRETGARAADTLFVGDTTFDVEMGKSAGVAVLGVAWGYHDPALLHASGAVAIVKTMDEVVHHALRLGAL